ncbi:peptide chain release factor N(5)-glutamine methyltransferase [Nitratireductor sp. ZSWI3]|uniref:peptide chain release factor N(5)-glutamine methyltransferase n=1 Tax=Nitratireductor sp. ZSWI3 TaxID=2966359 RepID=UPI00214FA73B|nr:peptide chain release factor N(5)-glutamine methyltransferase [Nitratireductor sp. ZSWI3]MCR4267943.1 peptide chain release factor N(5)-glutamine methyltransferase [Nitratireductor sp. ZSWI3]
MAEAGKTLGDLLAAARNRLAEAGISDAALDARLLVEHFTRTTRTDALARPEQPVDGERVKAVEAALDLRLGGMPVHRIIGRREFYGLDLTLAPETLEPRPDTETLVDLVLAQARRNDGEDRPWRILDLGTGTGAIALALLSALPQASAVGADISAQALATAEHNADINGYAGRFSTRLSDWFAKIEGCYDFIVSNPPYIRDEDWRGLSREVREFDPQRALVAGADGLDAYRAIVVGCSDHLGIGGMVAVEIGHDQKDAVTQLFAARSFRLVAAASDLAGHDRALIFVRSQ